MEERVKYFKQKFVYVVCSPDRDVMYCFGNIKGAVEWFAGSGLFPSLIIADYVSVVTVLRKHGIYSIHHYGQDWEIRQVKMVGVQIRSSRKAISEL